MLLLPHSQKLAQMNQHALLMICEGHHQFAKCVLHECLDKAVQRANGSACDFPGSLRSSLSVSYIPLVGSLGHDDDWRGYVGQYFEFHRFLFDLTETGVRLWDSVTYLTFSGIVGYNVAMIYHHEGLIEKDLFSLLAARTWYEYSVNMSLRGRDTSDQGTMMFRLSLYNNLGHLCSVLGDGAGVRQCRSELETELRSAHQIEEIMLGFFRHSLTLAWTHP